MPCPAGVMALLCCKKMNPVSRRALWPAKLGVHIGREAEIFEILQEADGGGSGGEARMEGGWLPAGVQRCVGQWQDLLVTSPIRAQPHKS